MSVSLVSPIDIKSYSGTVQAEVYRDNEEKDECRDVGDIRYYVLYVLKYAHAHRSARCRPAGNLLIILSTGRPSVLKMHHLMMKWVSFS